MSDLCTAVVLARGLGTRMKRPAGDAGALSDEQQSAADQGMKAMMPIGRPFLDHLMSSLADAGIVDVCLVIGPEHDAVRRYYDALATDRVRVHYAVQREPRGTADAVASAEAVVGDRRFVMVNGDNYYEADAVRRLREVPGNALLGYEREGLVRLSNIPAERISAFALVETRDGRLVDIHEKPSPERVEQAGPRALVSMNCFAFTPAVFDACRAVAPSPRGEYEIADGVRELMRRGHDVTVLPVSSGVLDLSSRGDVAAVEAALRDRPVAL